MVERGGLKRGRYLLGSIAGATMGARFGFTEVNRSPRNLTTEITSRVHGDTILVMPTDERLTAFDPSQQRLQPTSLQLDIPTESEVFRAETDALRDLPFDKESFDCVVSVWSQLGLLKRAAPFLELSEIVRPNGTLLYATGLQPGADTDADAKWWLGRSELLDLSEVVLTRHEEFQTPRVLAVYDKRNDGN